MKILIKNAWIFSPESPHHLKRKDILIENGIIQSVGNISSASQAEIWEGSDIIVTAPWADMCAFFCDPGQEHKETLKSGSDSASFSGIGHVLVHGHSQAPISHHSTVYKISRFEHPWTTLYPAASLTEKYEGKNLPEIFDMMQHGSFWFSDGHHAVNDEGSLLRILQYTLHLPVTPCFYPDTDSLSRGGLMNESIESVRNGMKGIPSLAEEIFLEKLIRLLEYSGGRAHIISISSAESVNILRKAKKKNLAITCSVPILNLVETDNALATFNTNLKVLPPLRTKKDLQALRKGLEDGTIDTVVSNHFPQAIEDKNVEFDFASEGHCTLPFFAPLVLNVIKDQYDLLSSVSQRPYSLMQIAEKPIMEGQEAYLSIFDSDAHFMLSIDKNPSISANSHYFNQSLKGKCLGIIKKNKVKRNA